MPGNAYAQVVDLKADLAISSSAQDAALARLVEDVSRGIDQHCRRPFSSQLTSTGFFVDGDRVRFYDGGIAAPGSTIRELWPLFDIIAVTELAVDQDGDGVYETVLDPNLPDYWLWPDNAVPHTPYSRMDLNPQGQLAAWPWGRRRVRVKGTAGYSNELQATGQTVADDPLTNVATTLTVEATAGISVGEALGLEAEQVGVLQVTSATALSIERAINGTTAAAHAKGVAVQRRRYPRDVERAAIMQASRLWRDAQTGYSGAAGNAQYGGYAFAATYPAIRDLLQPFMKMTGLQ